MTGSVSGVTNYLIAGADPGDSKLKKAKEKRVEVIDEARLFEMIRTLPAKEAPKGKAPSKRTSKGGRDSLSAITAARGNGGNNRNTNTRNSNMNGPGPVPALGNVSGVSSQILLVDKYAPKCAADLVGNKSNIQKLKKHLLDWDRIKNIEVKTTSTTKKGVLLSGPPGIGKTSAVRVVAAELGFNVVELNASDTRSQKQLRNIVEQSLDNRRMTDFFSAKTKNTKSTKSASRKRNLIMMDEVDGMGGGDRGGSQELIKFIKKTKVPIVCICNDRGTQKMRTLRSWCLDLIFRKPTAQMICHRLMRIAQNEGFQMEMPAIQKLAESTNGDIRQMLHMLQFWSNDSSSKKLSFRDVKDRMSNAAKDLTVGLWDVAPSFFRGGQSMLDLINNYFVDYSLVPLMVQESYLKLKKHNGSPRWNAQEMKSISMAAQSIADGDLIEARVRKSMQFGALPYHAVLSSIKPGKYAQSVGRMSAMMQFPQWFGKNSVRKKNTRLCTELACNINAGHRSLKTNHFEGFNHDINDEEGEAQKVTLTPTNITLDYLEILKIKLQRPLYEKGQDGIEDVIEFMKMYNLTKDNWDSLFEMGLFGKNPRKLDTKTKSALTRYCTKHLNVVDMASGRKLTKGSVNDLKVKKVKEEDDEEESESEDEGDISKDKRIKQKKPKAKRKTTAKGKGKAKAKKTTKRGKK